MRSLPASLNDPVTVIGQNSDRPKGRRGPIGFESPERAQDHH
jgi:hypothetical protein